MDTGLHTLVPSRVLVAGEVRDEEGEPVVHARVEVEVSVEGGGWRASRVLADCTGPDGRFRIRGRPDESGSLRLAVTKAGYTPRHPAFRAGQERVVVTLLAAAANPDAAASLKW